CGTRVMASYSRISRTRSRLTAYSSPSREKVRYWVRPPVTSMGSELMEASSEPAILWVGTVAVAFGPHGRLGRGHLRRRRHRRRRVNDVAQERDARSIVRVETEEAHHLLQRLRLRGQLFGRARELL